MGGLGGFALSGVAAAADISRRSKTASRQAGTARQVADGMRLGRKITVTPPLTLPSSMVTDGNTART